MKKPTAKKLPNNWKGTGHLPATKKQTDTIHAFKHSLQMSDDAYRMLIARHGQGVMHSNELSRKQASAVISEMEFKSGQTPTKMNYRFTRETGKPAKPGKSLSKDEAKLAISELLEMHGVVAIKTAPVTTKDNVVALATPPQRALIGHLVLEVNWYEHGSFEAWLLKNMGLEQVATKEEAARVIEGLKGLKSHGHAKKPT